MIEKPPRVAGLIGDWVAAKLCREAIFNLKLPMKKRFEELETCRAIIEKSWRRPASRPASTSNSSATTRKRSPGIFG